MCHYANLLRATLTISLMLLAMAGAAVAGPFDDATAAYQRGDYACELRQLRTVSWVLMPGTGQYLSSAPR